TAVGRLHAPGDRHRALVTLVATGRGAARLSSHSTAANGDGNCSHGNADVLLHVLVPPGVEIRWPQGLQVGVRVHARGDSRVIARSVSTTDHPRAPAAQSLPAPCVSGCRRSTSPSAPPVTAPLARGARAAVFRTQPPPRIAPVR